MEFSNMAGFVGLVTPYAMNQHRNEILHRLFVLTGLDWSLFWLSFKISVKDTVNDQ